VFFPFGDYPNPHTTPWVTRTLIAINVAVYLFVSVPLQRQRATAADLADPEIRAVLRGIQEEARKEGGGRPVALSRYDLYVMKHGYKPGRPEWFDLLVCMFLHANLMHLLGNMLFLWIYGDNVEARLGRLGYLVGYLVTGAAATLAFAALNSESMVPLVGASGAISGVLGFYLIWFPHNKVKVFLWFYWFVDVLHVPAAAFLILYVVLLQNVLPLLAGGGAASGVAYWAHLGGFAAGVLGAWLVNAIFGKSAAPKPHVPVRVHLDREALRRETRRAVEGPAERFERAMAEGRMEDAAYEFAGIVREGGKPPPPSLVFALGNWLYENGFSRDAASVFRYYIRAFPRGADLDRAHLGLGILLSRRLGQAAAAREHLHAAIDVAPAGSAVAENARAELRRLGG
jgi:membrane associated rhomboid family serine protease